MIQNGKIFSVTLHISGTIHYMIFISGTHVSDYNISSRVFHFFKILIFQVVRRVKGQKMAQNDKKLCPLCLYISGTIHHMIFIYGTHV